VFGIFAEMHVSISQEYCIQMARRNSTIAVWSDSRVVAGCGPTCILTSVLSIFVDIFFSPSLCNFPEVKFTGYQSWKCIVLYFFESS